MTTRGFVLGKFMPPHLGHQYLCAFAAARVDRLTILVCSLPDDPIPGALRHRWMQDLVPQARVLHHDRVVPQAPQDSPDFWPIWRTLIAHAHPEPIDLVFASEPYGHRLAAELGARFMPVDPGREVWAVSGTAVRQDPWRQWSMLPPPVRAWYARRVVLFGPESSGKTTLSRQLAAHFATIAVPEYARPYTQAFGTAVPATGFLDIAKGQEAARRALAPHANRILIEDTDAVLTAVWSDMLQGWRDPWFETGPVPADLYLRTTAADVPFVDDGTRYFPATAERERFDAACRAELERRGCRHVTIDGPWATRLPQAISAVTEAFSVSSD